MGIIGGWRIKYLKARQRKPRKKMVCYVERNENLSELGYESYRQYLASDDWKRIRESRLKAHPACVLCVGTATELHHLDYTIVTLLGMVRKRLVPLCRDCHHGIEFDGDRKRDLMEANLDLIRKARAAGLGRWVDSVGRSWKLVKELSREAEKKWQKAKDREAAKNRRKAKISATLLADRERKIARKDRAKCRPISPIFDCRPDGIQIVQGKRI